MNIKKKYALNTLQILSLYQLQDKLESVLQNINPIEISSDLPFFNEIYQLSERFGEEKAFIMYKFTLYCSILINDREEKFFHALFLNYTKYFLKMDNKYYPFVIIKIMINEIFRNINFVLTIKEFNKLIEEEIRNYKMNPMKSILEINMFNFSKNDTNKASFFIFLDCFKFFFHKEQIEALSKYIVINSDFIIKNMILENKTRVSFFKKLNNIIQIHIKNISKYYNENNSKRN